jgi:peroxiredoxin
MRRLELDGRRARVVDMKTSMILALLILGTGAVSDAAVGTGVGDKIPSFTAKAVDLSGAEPKTADVDSQKLARTTVYLFVGTQCPTTQAYVDRLRALEQEYDAKGIDFVYVYPNRTDTSEAKSAFHKERKLAGAMIDDEGAAIAKTLGAQRTAEAVVVGRDGEILYRGAIDDSAREPEEVNLRYVALALDEHLAGKPVSTKSAPVSA